MILQRHRQCAWTPVTGRLVLPLLLLVSLAAQAHAAVEASASLSRNVTSAGVPVRLTISVTGARGADAPREIRVDGLEIRHVGQSTQIQMRNFDMTATVAHTYHVRADEPGEYTIPAQRVRAGGTTVTTNPVTLVVRRGAGGLPPPSGSSRQARPSDEDVNLDDIAFAELIVPKSSVYVGEAIPIELRFYFDDDVNFRANSAPELTGEGFTAEAFPDPRQEKVERGGKVFTMVPFQTFIVPAKAGAIEIGPASMNVTASIPRARRNLRHFGLDDFFNDDFFNNPLSAFSVNREVTVMSGAQKLEVKPLPAEGQPPDFSGAIGQFEIEAEASAGSVKIGDPVTLEVRVSGRGNFDRIGEPEVETGRGWRSYPPSSTFQEDDTLRLSGTKTFEFALVPTRNETQLPPASFSYFDPARERYVTIKTDPIAIDVSGQAAAAPEPEDDPAAVAPTPEPDPAERDIHYILTGAAKWDRSFQPIHRTKVFWVAQAVPLAALLTAAAVLIHRRRASDVVARRLGELKARQARLRQSLRRKNLDGAAFYRTAVELLRTDTAIQTGQPPESVHLEDALASRTLDEATAAEVRALFLAHDEMAYAGHAVTVEPEASQRAAAVEAIDRFMNSHA